MMRKARPLTGEAPRQGRIGANRSRGYGIGVTIRAGNMQPLLIAISTTTVTYRARNATGPNLRCQTLARRRNVARAGFVRRSHDERKPSYSSVLVMAKTLLKGDFSLCQ